MSSKRLPTSNKAPRPPGLVPANLTRRKKKYQTRRPSPDQVAYKKAAASELLARRLATDSLIDFSIYTNPNYSAQPHHRMIADRLMALERGDVKRLIVLSPPRHGKACADSTPVWTPAGLRGHGTLEVGDYVLGSDGCPTRVLATSERVVSNMAVTTSAD